MAWPPDAEPVIAAMAETAMAAETKPEPGSPVTHTTAASKAGETLATVPKPTTAAVLPIAI
ncbi:MAG: hypothetical protein V2J20_10290 [Wenzhouxiangella sp.]|jgi:hypothetical protein|nr:hypothetical protein [Wenzhouxiangella sp.]